ncbi:hypothetical protein CXG81DRAFT_12018 [Caulochytrium protostelioides]|uniref:Voltage-dependent ion-selective channel n=1 Tax=Caulochytrium protostelioides TaxID=1555241 RepID=A0A4P9X8N1_9FUNG|nr:hypothetical protein CXG81DRAFT_12018 [Caulochytrium protostelioides]|eukprot:RKP01420.1 hypothetical protein CXG81DRAFT_12018 [Caulochytrium protostelioides]
MSFPSFTDVGKPCNDLLKKDFPVGTVKVEGKFRTTNGVNFTTTAVRNNKDYSYSFDHEGKYAHKPLGLTLTLGVSSANLVTAKAELLDQLARGLKTDVQAQVLTTSLTTNVRVSSEFKRSFLASSFKSGAAIVARGNADIHKGPLLSGDVAVSANNVVAGIEGAYDVQEKVVKRAAYVLGYINPEYKVSLHLLNGGKLCSLAYHHRVSRDVEAAVNTTLNPLGTSSLGDVSAEMGLKYVLDPATFVKAKLDTQGRLGLGYTQILRPGVKLSLGSVVETGKLAATAVDANNIKFGTAFVIEG